LYSVQILSSSSTFSFLCDFTIINFVTCMVIGPTGRFRMWRLLTVSVSSLPATRSPSVSQG
jgi:hypothetical protein